MSSPLSAREPALAEYEKAITLNPNQSDVLAMMSVVMTLSGSAEEAIEWLEKAKRLNPYHPVWYDWNGCIVYFMARHYEKALRSTLRETSSMASPRDGRGNGAARAIGLVELRIWPAFPRWCRLHR